MSQDLTTSRSIISFREGMCPCCSSRSKRIVLSSTHPPELEPTSSVKSHLVPFLCQSLLASAPSESNTAFTLSPLRLEPSSHTSFRRIPASSTTSRRRQTGF
ncbi:hypothetical protein M404DRAFT_378368 [Pisolithus tinctorius Marx 270]|uniref:Uncharacterized protein n=1 Tax=Pisolithus tinctorius Marx 270 TaxID=870435 RepID=A0A0C3KEF5_PISTI|nr:hypothetical protein M404DRAFT_378368 [Pisolithus tinctorius Marx 270]